MTEQCERKSEKVSPLTLCTSSMTDNAEGEADDDMDVTATGPSKALSIKQVRLLLAEGVDLCAGRAGKKTTVLDADCDPDALERRHRGTLWCNCPREFDSALEFESHYASRHRLACIECRAAFPTEHLLELHITESHDPIFAARPSSADRPKYACVVEGCRECFASWADRKAHACETHRYPSSFAYFPPEPGKKPTAKPCQQRGGIPKSICFGHGSQVAWHRRTLPTAPRKPAKDIDMKDVAEALMDSS